ALPLDRPRVATSERRSALYQHRLRDDVARRLHELASEEAATLYMVGLAAFAELLARYGDQRDLLIGTPVAGRLQAELEHLIGCFINMLLLRIDLTEEPTFRELVSRTRGVVLEALARQE